MNEDNHSAFKQRCPSFAVCDWGVLTIRAIALTKR